MISNRVLLNLSFFQSPLKELNIEVTAESIIHDVLGNFAAGEFFNLSNHSNHNNQKKVLK
jgi:hypothetical protein